MSRSTKKFVFFYDLFIYLFCSNIRVCFQLVAVVKKTYMAQGLVNGVLNETWNLSCLQFEWFSVAYGFI